MITDNEVQGSNAGLGAYDLLREAACRPYCNEYACKSGLKSSSKSKLNAFTN